MILICYDGSDDARSAIEHAAELFAEEPATVLTVWQPFIEIVARTTVGFGMLPTIPDVQEIDGASRKAAHETAQQGVELAQGLGMKAELLCCSQGTTTVRAILAEAEKVGARAIVMGSRGLTGLKSLLLGSVSHEVLQHADRTVVVVPSPEVARRRARAIEEESAV